jgi:hypothetical protein
MGTSRGRAKQNTKKVKIQDNKRHETQKKSLKYTT